MQMRTWQDIIMVYAFILGLLAIIIYLWLQ